MSEPDKKYLDLVGLEYYNTKLQDNVVQEFTYPMILGSGTYSSSYSSANHTTTYTFDIDTSREMTNAIFNKLLNYDSVDVIEIEAIIDWGIYQGQRVKMYNLNSESIYIDGVFLYFDFVFTDYPQKVMHCYFAIDTTTEIITLYSSENVANLNYELYDITFKIKYISGSNTL